MTTPDLERAIKAACMGNDDSVCSIHARWLNKALAALTPPSDAVAEQVIRAGCGCYPDVPCTYPVCDDPEGKWPNGKRSPGWCEINIVNRIESAISAYLATIRGE